MSGQAVRFVIVGLLNTVVDLGAFYLLGLIPGMSHVGAKAISYFLGICNSFVWNKYWTFGAKGSERGKREFAVFFLVNTPPLAVNVVVFTVLGLWLDSGSFLLRMSKAFIAAVIAVVWNFLGSRYIAFRHTALNRPLKDGVSPGAHRGRGSVGHAQDKDAKSVNSSAIGATEDEVLGRPVRPDGRDAVLQRPLKGAKNG